MFCKAKRQKNFSIQNSVWDEFPWEDIPSNRLENHMGQRPGHFPKTEVKVAYDNVSICLMFRVEDRYVRAITETHQGNVFRDSCVEFFFTTGADVSKGYFNLEMNCGGTMLFHFQRHPRKDRRLIPVRDCSKIDILHSLPRIVAPEIEKPLTWSVAYRIPIALLKRYCPVITPAPKAEWRVNFYKCADDTSHPHWLTWSPVDLPEPNFHHPQSFGVLQFE